MKMKVLVIALVALIVINLATLGSYLYFRATARPVPAFWQRGPHGPDRPGPDGPPVDLRPEQMRQLRGALRAFEAESRADRMRLHALEDSLVTLIMQDNPAEEAIDAIVTDIGVLRAELMRTATRNMIDAKQYLTPTQQRRFFHRILSMRPGPPMQRGPNRRGDGPPMDRPHWRDRFQPAQPDSNQNPMQGELP